MTYKTKRRDWKTYPMDAFAYCEGLWPWTPACFDELGHPVDCRDTHEPFPTWCSSCAAQEMRSRLIEIDGEEAESK